MGLGSIERPQPHKGAWRCRVWWQDAGGRRRSAYVYGPTEKACQALAQARQTKEVQDVQRELAGVLVRRRACPTLTEYVLEHHAAIWPDSDFHRRNQLAALGRYIEPTLGTSRLDAITRADVAALMAQARSRGLTAGTWRRVLAALSKVLAHATAAQVLTHNVCRGDGIPLTSRQTLRAVESYTLEEVELILAHAAADPVMGARWAPFYAVLAYTGARPRSVRHLKVGDVRLTANPPVVIYRRTKSGADVEVPLVAPVVKVLEDLVKGRGADEWVFVGLDSGRRQTDQPIGGAYGQCWRRACRAAGLRVLPPYSLRRSFITNTLEAGVGLTTVRDLVGHSSVAVTDRYAGSRTRQAQAASLSAVWPGAHVVQTEDEPGKNEPQSPKTGDPS